MHDACLGKVQSPELKHSSLLLFSCRTNMQVERRRCVYRTIQQLILHNIT